MGIFDRWTSRKGKAEAKPKSDQSEDDKKRAFASVPSGKDATKEAKVDQKSEPKAQVTEKPIEQDRKKNDKPEPAAPVAKGPTDRAYRTLIRPLVTEKTSRVAGQYTFEVGLKASKIDVRNAVQQVYGIRPVAVNMLRQQGKVVRYGRSYGRTVDTKKAMITLPPGKTIEVFNG